MRRFGNKPCCCVVLVLSSGTCVVAVINAEILHVARRVASPKFRPIIHRNPALVGEKKKAASIKLKSWPHFADNGLKLQNWGVILAGRDARVARDNIAVLRRDDD